jgi:endonuclease YncB( thermonuclease family)
VRWPFLLLALALIAPAAAEARTFDGRVAKVVDGDTVKVKEGSKTRAFNLAGVVAPTGGACFAAESKAGLGRLLARNAAVKVRTTGAGARISRAGTSVNRSVVKRGLARARSGGGAFGAQLREDQAAARAAGRGLHSACRTPDPGPPKPDEDPPPSGDLTGKAAIDRMKAELTGMFFRNFSSGSNSSSTYTIHWCPGSAWRSFTESLFSSGGTSFSSRREYLGNPWNVTEAEIKENGNRYALVAATARSTATNSGPEPLEGDPNSSTRFEFENGQWYWAGEPAQAFPGEANCQPVLDHG